MDIERADLAQAVGLDKVWEVKERLRDASASYVIGYDERARRVQGFDGFAIPAASVRLVT